MSDSASSVITEELRAWVGRTTPRRPLELLTPADIRRYVDATADANPLWLEDEFARSVGYGGRLLPPTLVGWIPFSIKDQNKDPQTADLRRLLPLPRNFTNVRNAGSETEWLKPVYLGETLVTQSCIVDIVARQGKTGLGIYVTQEERVLNSNNEVVLCSRHTVVIFPETKLSETQKAEGNQ